MLESKAPIILVFYGVRPSNLRMEDHNGLYWKALEKCNVKVETLQKWRDALKTFLFIIVVSLKGKSMPPFSFINFGCIMLWTRLYEYVILQGHGQSIGRD